MVNPTSNAILEWIHQVVRNLVQTFNITQTYVYEDDPWLVILDAESFTIPPTTNRLKVYSLSQLLFCRDLILLIKNRVGWELICHIIQEQINKDNIHENIYFLP